MPLKTRNSKTQRFNRRKSRKIGGTGTNSNKKSLEKKTSAQPSVAAAAANSPPAVLASNQLPAAEEEANASRSGTQNAVNNDKCIKKGDLVTDNNNKLLGIVESIDNATSEIKIKDVDVKKNISDVKLYQYYDILGLLSQIVTNVIEMKNEGLPEDINNISKLKEYLKNAVPLLKSEPNISHNNYRSAGFSSNSDDESNRTNRNYTPPPLRV